MIDFVACLWFIKTRIVFCVSKSGENVQSYKKGNDFWEYHFLLITPSYDVMNAKTVKFKWQLHDKANVSSNQNKNKDEFFCSFFNFHSFDNQCESCWCGGAVSWGPHQIPPPSTPSLCIHAPSLWDSDEWRHLCLLLQLGVAQSGLQVREGGEWQFSLW